MHVYNPAHLLGGKLRIQHSSQVGVELHHLFVYICAVFGGKVPANETDQRRLFKFTARHCQHLYVVRHEDYLKVRCAEHTIVWLHLGLNIGRASNWQVARQPERANFRGDAGRFTTNTDHLFRNMWQQIKSATVAAEVVANSHDFAWNADCPEMVNPVSVAAIDVQCLVNTALAHYNNLPIESSRLATRMAEFLCNAGLATQGIALDKFYGAYMRKEITPSAVAGVPWTVARSCR